MFIGVIGLLTIIGWYEVQCYVPVPSIYREANQAIRDYAFQTEANPVVYSLLNVLIHDKRAKAFINNEAVEQVLNEVKKFNPKDEEILRSVIFGEQSPGESIELSDELKQRVQSALDAFFTDDYQTLT